MSIVDQFKAEQQAAAERAQVEAAQAAAAPSLITRAGLSGGLAGTEYDGEADAFVAGILAEFEANPDDMELAGAVSDLYENGAPLIPRLSVGTAQKLSSNGAIAAAIIQQAARRQSEWGENPNYPTTATLVADGPGTFESETVTLRPLGSGTADADRPLTLLSFLGFSTKADGTCECKVTDILKNGAPQLATVGGVSNGGGFFFERIRPVNLQGPHLRPIMSYGLNYKVGDTYAIRATVSAAGTYHFELDFAVRPFAASDQRAPSMFGGGTAAALSRAIGNMTAAPKAPVLRPAIKASSPALTAALRPGITSLMSRFR